MKNKRFLLKIFFLGIIAFFFIDFLIHARIMIVYPMKISFIFFIVFISILFYFYHRMRKR
ncbi:MULTISPECIES: hypothetical protein [Niallia]|uniref:Uncharacterized protein n=1 Tax=Niallia alba TaxID=2729105 RepID=A0A7Y0PN78_9BACI|nr:MULTISPECIES: hypothetical protein [Niallia]MBQ6447567.1 hypothetical protein [Bacillus sp. (in: firmicutes)]NMO78076.1 hypothetical protein [Niallia alba]UTI41365.1 hypothetical protein NKG37_21345 [Niallia sp. RD1]